MSGSRVLVIDGNVAEIRARQIAALGYDSGTGYARVLKRIDASLRVDIVKGADADPQFPEGVGLADYDGVTMTGSALNIYNGGPAVMRRRQQHDLPSCPRMPPRPRCGCLPR